MDSPYVFYCPAGVHLQSFLLIGDQNAGKSTFMSSFGKLASGFWSLFSMFSFPVSSVVARAAANLSCFNYHCSQQQRSFLFAIAFVLADSFLFLCEFALYSKTLEGHCEGHDSFTAKNVPCASFHLFHLSFLTTRSRFHLSFRNATNRHSLTLILPVLPSLSRAIISSSFYVNSIFFPPNAPFSDECRYVTN